MVEKRAVLFINGELDNLQAMKAVLRESDLLVAVDGGLRYFAKMGLSPHLLIGDLDSVDPKDVLSVENTGTRVVRYPVEKDDTDLELALNLVIDEGYTAVRIAAALGGRIDHTLGNLFLLTRPGLEKIDLRILGPGEEIFVIRQDSEITGKQGDTISLIPLDGPASGVTTQGLYYPLNGETLYPYHTRGISNVMLDARARVRLKEGLLLCVHLSK
jgi:thiamine pyrophosphokinase